MNTIGIFLYILTLPQLWLRDSRELGLLKPQY